MTRAELLAFLRSRKYAVETSVASDGAPEAAVVGVAVMDDFELVFDTLTTTRKAQNLRVNPRVAFVFGSLEDGAAQTLQYEGVADQPSGPELRPLLELYLYLFPDGRERRSLPDITYFRVRPAWIRYSDYGTDPPAIVELTREELARLG